MHNTSVDIAISKVCATTQQKSGKQAEQKAPIYIPVAYIQAEACLDIMRAKDFYDVYYILLYIIFVYRCTSLQGTVLKLTA